jgi:hypothetical protein
MDRSGFAERHFRRDFAVAIADPLAMLFQKLSESSATSKLLCRQRKLWHNSAQTYGEPGFGVAFFATFCLFFAVS